MSIIWKNLKSLGNFIASRNQRLIEKCFGIQRTLSKWPFQRFYLVSAKKYYYAIFLISKYKFRFLNYFI